MANYDRRIINEFADRLYNRAGTVIFTYTFIGILAGGAFYPFSKTTAIILAAVFGFIGFLIGNEKAFWYRLQAQITLCQAKIEENTSNDVQLPNKTDSIQVNSTINKNCPNPVESNQNVVIVDNNKIECPHCNAKLKLDEKELRANKFWCPGCKTEIEFVASV